MIVALWLLLSASDLFGSIDPQWSAGLRGLPDVSLAQIDGDSCLVLRATATEPTPYFDDYVRSCPRPVLKSEHPFCVAHIWLAPFNEWPTTPNANGNYIYCGFRVTETRDQNNALLWPGIFIGRSGGGAPALFVRVLTGFESERILSASGWWTLGIGWSDGILSFYAAVGRTILTESDRFATDTAPFPVAMKSVNGWFLDVSVEEGATLGSAWFFGSVQLFADIQPSLSISREGELIKVLRSGCYTNEPYLLQISDDLYIWNDVQQVMNDGLYQQVVNAPSKFYRLSNMLPEFTPNDGTNAAMRESIFSTKPPL